MLVDVNAALEELGLEKDDFIEFMGDLNEFLEEGMPALKGAIDSEDFVEIRAQAHAIKGALANLRFIAGAAVAKKLEDQGMRAVNENLMSDFLELEKTLSDSFLELG